MNELTQRVRYSIVDGLGGKRILRIDFGRGEAQEQALYNHERVILTTGICKSMLPFYSMESYDGGTSLYFDTDGYVPIYVFPFRHVVHVLRAYRSILNGLHDAEDCMLDGRRVPLDANLLFIHPKKQTIRMIYFPVCCELPVFKDAFCELINTESFRNERIIGIKAALEELEAALAKGNASYGECLRIIESIQSKWSLIHPEYFEIRRKEQA